MKRLIKFTISLFLIGAGIAFITGASQNHLSMGVILLGMAAIIINL